MTGIDVRTRATTSGVGGDAAEGGRHRPRGGLAVGIGDVDDAAARDMASERAPGLLMDLVQAAR
ncbi:hypothetical protein SMICM304S_05977 [Streptomyces microflavus]